MRHVFLFALLVLAGCAKPQPAGTAQRGFDSPESAVTAMVTALEQRDRATLVAMLGPDSDALLSSGDAVADSTARADFLARYAEKNALVSGGPDDLVLQVGADDWPFPIPIVRRNGKWILDAAAGKDEILKRRIGGNELQTIEVMHGYVAAQDDYAAAPHDGIPAGTYASTFRSDPGKQNGLYWEVAPGARPSPAGPWLAEAAAEGYGAAGEPYHGYRFRLLNAQGPAAAGGAQNYVVDGRQTGGYALIAWPASYGASGVMTFLVARDGVVWQRDLGAGTEQAAQAITAFDPDSLWTPIPAEAD